MSKALRATIEQIFQNNDYGSFKLAAIEIDCAYMASTLGAISLIEWQKGEAGLRFFRFMRQMMNRYDWVAKAVIEETEEIIRDYQ